MNPSTQFVETFVTREIESAYRPFAFRAGDADELRRWQQRFRTRLSQLLGLDVIDERRSKSLDPQKLGEEELDDHIREEWSIESEAGFRLSFYLLKPKKQTEPHPLVITPHGHSVWGRYGSVGIAHTDAARQSLDEGERDIALQAVREGYIAIAPDIRGFDHVRLSEHIEKDQNSCSRMQMRSLMFGRTLIGERVWDMSRLIDYAESRPDIDASRIVITGNSGGGTVALFAAACDERISLCMPGSYFCTFADSIGSVRHCECNYIPEILRTAEEWDVAGLIAPRPFLAINGQEDVIFPIDATRRAFEKLKGIYRVAGAEARCELYEGNGGHRYYKERAWTFAAQWLGS